MARAWISRKFPKIGKGMRSQNVQSFRCLRIGAVDIQYRGIGDYQHLSHAQYAMGYDAARRNHTFGPSVSGNEVPGQIDGQRHRKVFDQCKPGLLGVIDLELQPPMRQDR